MEQSPPQDAVITVPQLLAQTYDATLPLEARKAAQAALSQRCKPQKDMRLPVNNEHHPVMLGEDVRAERSQNGQHPPLIDRVIGAAEGWRNPYRNATPIHRGLDRTRPAPSRLAQPHLDSGQRERILREMQEAIEHGQIDLANQYREQIAHASSSMSNGEIQPEAKLDHQNIQPGSKTPEVDLDLTSSDKSAPQIEDDKDNLASVENHPPAAHDRTPTAEKQLQQDWDSLTRVEKIVYPLIGKAVDVSKSAVTKPIVAATRGLVHVINSEALKSDGSQNTTQTIASSAAENAHQQATVFSVTRPNPLLETIKRSGVNIRVKKLREEILRPATINHEEEIDFRRPQAQQLEVSMQDLPLSTNDLREQLTNLQSQYDRELENLRAIQPIEIASKTTPSPDHSDYCADAVFAGTFADGLGGVVAAMDGVGSGGALSVAAATEVKNGLAHLLGDLKRIPTINEAIEIIGGRVETIQSVIAEYKRKVREQDSRADLTNIDTTASINMIVRSPTPQDDGSNRYFVVSANAGDSRSHLIRSTPNGKYEYRQLTKDDSLVQQFIDGGLITDTAAFNHPDRNIITRTLGDGNELRITVHQVEEGDLIFTTTDGIHDQFPPTDSQEGIYPFPTVATYCYAQARRTANPLTTFCTNLTHDARDVMQAGKTFSKNDDTGVGALMVHTTDVASKQEIEGRYKGETAKLQHQLEVAEAIETKYVEAQQDLAKARELYKGIKTNSIGQIQQTVDRLQDQLYQAQVYAFETWKTTPEGQKALQLLETANKQRGGNFSSLKFTIDPNLRNIMNDLSVADRQIGKNGFDASGEARAEYHKLRQVIEQTFDIHVLDREILVPKKLNEVLDTYHIQPQILEIRDRNNDRVVGNPYDDSNDVTKPEYLTITAVPYGGFISKDKETSVFDTPLAPRIYCYFDENGREAKKAQARQSGGESEVLPGSNSGTSPGGNPEAPIPPDNPIPTPRELVEQSEHDRSYEELLLTLDETRDEWRKQELNMRFLLSRRKENLLPLEIKSHEDAVKNYVQAQKQLLEKWIEINATHLTSDEKASLNDLLTNSRKSESPGIFAANLFADMVSARERSSHRENDPEGQERYEQVKKLFEDLTKQTVIDRTVLVSGRRLSELPAYATQHMQLYMARGVKIDEVQRDDSRYQIVLVNKIGYAPLKDLPSSGLPAVVTVDQIEDRQERTNPKRFEAQGEPVVQEPSDNLPPAELFRLLLTNAGSLLPEEFGTLTADDLQDISPPLAEQLINNIQLVRRAAPPNQLQRLKDFKMAQVFDNLVRAVKMRATNSEAQSAAALIASRLMAMGVQPGTDDTFTDEQMRLINQILPKIKAV